MLNARVQLQVDACAGLCKSSVVFLASLLRQRTVRSESLCFQKASLTEWKSEINEDCREKQRASTHSINEMKSMDTRLQCVTEFVQATS